MRLHPPSPIENLFSHPELLPAMVGAMVQDRAIPFALELAQRDPHFQPLCVAQAMKMAARAANAEALRAFAPLCSDFLAPETLDAGTFGASFSLLETVAGSPQKKSVVECLKFLLPLAEWDTKERPCGALNTAIFAANQEAVDFLLPLRGAQSRDGLGRTPLLCAAQNSNLNLVQRLTPDSDLAERFEVLDGGDVLMAAARQGYALTVLHLLASGCDPRAVDNKGQTALMHAVLNAKSSVAAALLPVSDLEHADNEGLTAFAMALHDERCSYLAGLPVGSLATERDIPSLAQAEPRFEGDDEWSNTMARLEALALRRTVDNSATTGDGARSAPKRPPRSL